MSRDPLTLFLKERSRRRFAELVAARRELILNVAWRVLGDGDAAEDVAQEVLLKLLDLRIDPGGVRSPRGFLVTMTVNAARSRLRGEGRRRSREREAARGREEGVMSSESLTEVREAVLDLPEDLRACVELRYFGGLPLADVARAGGLAVRTVNLRLEKARSLLRARLADAVPAGFLAYLAGEQEDGLPALEPSRRFLDRTDRMAAEIAPSAARSTGLGVVPGLAAVCALLVVALLLLFGDGGGNGPDPASRDLVDAAVPGGPPGSPEPALGETGPGATSRAADEGLGTSDADDRSRGEGGDTGFRIRVTDEEGNLLREGELLIGLAGLPDFDLLAKLRAWEGLLQPQSLAAANPFEVSGLPPAAVGLEIEVSARVPGRPPTAKREFTIRGGEAPDLTLVAPLPREISVLVLSRFSGKPVEGAAVVSLTELRRREIEASDALGTVGPGSAVTGHDGRCRLAGLGEGPHDLEVHAPGHAAVHVVDRELGEEARFRLEPLREAAAVLVTVTDPAGRPVPGQRVRLDAEGASIEVALRTDARGTCRFSHVVPGFHSVHLDLEDWIGLARARGWKDRDATVLSLSFELAAGGEERVRLGYVSCTSSLTAEVRDPRGAPRPGVELTLFGPRMVTAKTDRSGRAAFPGLPPGEYQVSLLGWFYAEEIDLGEEEERVVSFVAGEASIRGRAAPGARISVSGPAFEFARAGADGTFEAGSVPPGTYEVRAWAEELLSLPARVEVKGGEDPLPLELEMVRGGRILVTFREPDRRILAGAEIRLLDDRGEEYALNPDGTGEFDRRTLPLLPGRYEIQVTLPGGAPRGIAVEITGGRDTRVELGLP